MKRTLLPGLCLFCMGLLAPCLAGDEPGYEKLRLFISARDPGGGKLTFTWKQLPNEAPRVKIADPNAGKLENGKWISETYFIPTEPGKYLFEVSVKNEAGEESKKVFQQEVVPPVPAPTAIAGRDQDGKKLNETVVLNGGASKAAEGRSIKEWDWRVAKAPGDFKLDTALLKGRSFEFTPKEPGEYQFELKVSDGKKWSEPARTKVTVLPPPPPPVAAAGREQSRTAGDTVRLDGSESKPAPGQTITAWEWRVAQGPADFKPEAKLLKEKTFEFKPETAGVYQFELRVSDGERWSEPSRTTVTVTPPIPPPTAVGGKDQTKTVGELVRLNGVDSKPAEGQNIAEWEWRVVKAPEKFELDAKALKERSFDFKAKLPGVYQFELKVSDGKRWSEPSPVMVTITPGQPPKLETTEPAPPVELPGDAKVAAPKKPAAKPIVAPGGTVKLGETIVLDGSKSVVDEALNPEFIWKQDTTKGVLVRQLTPNKSKPFSQARLADPLNYPVWTCKPEQAGEYTFVLEVSTRGGDAQPVGKVESEPVVFNVVGGDKETPPPPPPAAGGPVAKITADRVQASAGDMVKLDGSKSTGEKLEYVWGPVPGKRYPKSWAGTEGPQVEFKAEEEGEYTVALMVKDAAGKFSEQAQVTVKVGGANQAPVLKVPKAFECVVGEQVRIEAEATDADNDPIEYKWTCVDPADLVIPDKLARNSILVFVPKNPGTYLFQATVSDGKGHNVSGQTMVGVKDPLVKPPTAVVEGPKKPVGMGAKVKLSGARSNDPTRKTLTYSWKQESGPNDVKVPGAVPAQNEKEWEFTPTDPGRYVFSLVVSNGINKSDPDKFELTVTKNNNPPAANIVGPAGGRVAVGEQVTLDGSTSSDPENDKLTFKWKKADLAPKNNVKPGEAELGPADQEKLTLKALKPGPVRVELIVNDGTTDSDPTYVELLIARPNNPPVAKVAGPAAAKVGTAVELSAAESSDPDGDEITSYVWSQPADGGPEIGVHGRDLRKKTLRFKPERPGTYVVNLEVVDAEGAKSETVSHKVEVKGQNKAPIAVAAVTGPPSVAVGAEVKLSSRGSRDPEGGQLTYKWKQIDGEMLPPFTAGGTVDGEVVNVVPKTAGKYTFELIVHDGEQESLPAAVSVTAKAPSAPPVAVIADVIPCEPGERVTLDGTASRDPNGDKIDEYRWSQVSGPEAKFPWRGTGKAKTEAVLTKEGEYVFELKVFNGKEWSEPSRAVVKTRSTNVPPVAAFSVPEMRSEENLETVLDASESKDPDNGPRPLTFSWKQASGPKVELASEGAKARFTPKKAGVLVFQVRVSDGKAESLPADIKVEVMKAGALPVAAGQGVPNPVKAAQKGAKNDPNILILDATKSRAGAGGPNAKLTYQWKQISGEDLRLKPVDLAKERVGLRVFMPGAYRFMLVVSDGQNRSAPCYVDVQVIEGTKPEADAPAPPPAPKEVNEKKPGDAGAKDGAADGVAARETQQPKATEPPAPPPAPPLNPQARAMIELAKQPGAEAEKALVAGLASSDTETRSAAAVALTKRGMSVVPALIEVLEKGSAQAKKEAHFALREITHESLPLDARKWDEWWKSRQDATGGASASSGK